jgi:CDGSH-type Zn-finger protein
MIMAGIFSFVASSLPAAAWASSASATTTVPQTDPARTVWLCRPGLADNPCDGSMATTTVTANGQRSVQADTVNNKHRDECFYLYPTASNETTTNSDLTVQPTETSIAMDQAARFSSVCNIWAPMYHQITVHGLSQANTTDPGAYTVAFNSVLSDWNDFITHYDDGHPIVFIGHSQGSVMLIKLLQAKVDTDPVVRNLMVTAIIAGGNVTVPTGKAVGATFKNLPLCTSAELSRCVIAYSSFPSEPPANANFGRPGQGISLNTDQTATSGVRVACVNPAAIGGGTAYLKTYWPVTTPLPIPSMAPSAPSVTTPWLYYPRQYTGTCESKGGATWLQVTAVAAGGDTRPVVNEIAGPTWGYHFQDLNLALGNLVNDVHTAEAAYSS